MKSTVIVVVVMMLALGIKSLYFADKVTESDNAVAPALSYARHVKPIFRKNCSGCHNADSGLPNWLDYQTAYDSREKIREKVLETGVMPPLGANGFGLNRHEAAVLKLWLDQGAQK
jgi:mono/diheme cytochrome c family protein